MIPPGLKVVSRIKLVVLGIANFAFGMSIGALIMKRPIIVAPPAPSGCVDTMEIVRESADPSAKCTPEQTMDTTRIAEGGYTHIMVRCWCPGHAPKEER